MTRRELPIIPPLLAIESYLHRKRSEFDPIRMDVR
jgi:hypothetical protein